MVTNNSQKPLCTLLVEKLPELRTTIEAVFGCDERLLTMCKDYEACAAALAYWRASQSKHAKERREEFTQLLDDLETEIIEYIQTRI